MERFKVGSKFGWRLGVLLTIIVCFGIITLICPIDSVRAESKLAGKEVRIGAAWGLETVCRHHQGFETGGREVIGQSGAFRRRPADQDV